MQYLHHLMPFIDFVFFVDQDSNFPWANWGMQSSWMLGNIFGHMDPCSTLGKAP
jgi:hypothetical protein